MTARIKSSRLISAILLFLIVGIGLSGYRKSDSIAFYVYPDGSVSADVNISSPPASLPAAVEKGRDLRKSGNTDPATIYLREGRHQLDQTLVLGIEDGALAPDKSSPFEQYGAGESGPTQLTFAVYTQEFENMTVT